MKPTRKVRVISLWQPWASAMAFKMKLNETRHWATGYRGPLAIHAATRKTELPEWSKRGSFYVPGAPIPRQLQEGYQAGQKYWGWPDMFPLGVIVGITFLKDCVRATSIERNPIEEALGGYADDRFAWITEGMQALTSPIPMKGHQGFWTWDVPEHVPIDFDAFPKFSLS